MNSNSEISKRPNLEFELFEITQSFEFKYQLDSILY